MSATTSLNKAYSYEASPHRTPKIKEIAPASCSNDFTKDASPQSILMDEWGQTPDHFYLAKKAPSSFYQVKRKLDLRTVGATSIGNSKVNQRRLRKKPISKKLENKTTPDKPRYDTSLGQLTKKFLRLLAEATDGVINLNTACSLLAVPKRRLYDITNVLEGAGLIQKTSRNNIQWMGRVSSPCASLMKFEIEKEIDILEAKENKLDELIYHMKCEINTFKQIDEKFLYVTSGDLAIIEEFADKMLIGINMPPNTQAIETNGTSLVVTSQSTEIEASLLSDDVSFLNIADSTEEMKEPIIKSVKKSQSYIVKIDKNEFITGSDGLKTPKKDSLDPLSLPEKVPSPSISDTPKKSDTPKRSDTPKKSDSPEKNDSSSLDITPSNVWTECLEGDPVIRNAFISEEDDIAPMGKHFLLQTQDQDDEFLPFSYFEDSIDAYSFSLDVGEGLTDLYDCGFSCP